MNEIKATTAGKIQVGDTIIVNEPLKITEVLHHGDGTTSLFYGNGGVLVRPSSGLIYREVAR